MTTRAKNRLYWWIGKNGGFQVGRLLIVDGCCVSHPRVDAALMQPAHAGAPVWVRVDHLHQYPSEPIAEPTVKGGA